MFASPGSRGGNGQYATYVGMTIFPQTTVKATGTQNISISTWTTIAWSALVRDDIGGSWSSSDNTHIYVRDARITRFRARCHMSWGGGGYTGSSYFQLQQNGVVINVRIGQGGSASARSEKDTTTGWMTCKAGDVFLAQTLEGNSNPLGVGSAAYPYFLSFDWATG